MSGISRIPTLNDVSFDGALWWFAEMQARDLLFHPEDDPASIVLIKDGTQAFSAVEVEDARHVLGILENGIGHEAVCAAAYPIFMNAVGIRLDA